VQENTPAGAEARPRLVASARGIRHDWRMSKPLAIRLAATAVACIVAAWFALGAVQARDTNRADAILSSSQTLTAGQASTVSSLLRTAGTLNPDTEVEVLRGQLELAQGDKAKAMRTFERVARREPENIVPLAWLGRMGDLQAVARIAKLEPPVR
jgi:Flp pilus assembly protein TadD